MIFSKDRPFLLVGAGKMGGAMLAGWMAEGVEPSAVVISDPSPSEEVVKLIQTHQIRHVTVPDSGLRPAVIMVAVKPQLMDAVLPTLSGCVEPDTLLLSVAAGTPVSKFKGAFGDVPIARAMPNTPAMVGRGVTAVYPNDKVTEAQKQTVGQLLSAVGNVVWLDSEEQIDLVTGVSGSGPAYVFWLAECLAQAGVEAGLPKDTAHQLAVATVTGAGELMHQSEETPSALRKNVTSPNGTTAAALDVLMADTGMEPLMVRAVAAAVKRAKELAAA
ncbi:pyrroline-5-carboxylate reductase [Roseibium hamelinense]|uniref:Pyrroline-5-carboxylate reductase n=1 Tax=Roseibium hamelinense TaxID=150831 RepID=A0A562SYS4_9HYPH|nr:pyrroline-5-carboxylate reductase [Roseibium hamelinense]MTI43636.1 pyrroline-5-carboxylate reductase [Roseibium hamelinense]TWI86154.1 pyrroline-5-carboxylate reductase [Roseibium hamelinense]